MVGWSAIDINKWFLPLFELDRTPQLVQNIKLAESNAGTGIEYVRLSGKMLNGAHRDLKKSIVEAAMALRSDLSGYLDL